jgi:hypothetical protein
VAAANLAADTPTAQTVIHRPNMHQIALRVRDQWKVILAGQKSGKIPSNQAKVLITKLISIHTKKEAFLRQDVPNDLTADQTSRLNQLLDATEASIPQ